MALFKLPERTTEDISNILKKTQETHKPKIKLKKGTLMEKISSISRLVEKNLGSEKNNFLLITDEQEWINYCKKAVEDGVVALDTETDSLNSILCNLVGVCVYSESQKPAYIPVGHISPITDSLISGQVSKDGIRKGLNIMSNCGVKFILHNAYYDLVVLHQTVGVDIDCYWDTLLAANLLNENESHSLKDLYIKYCIDENKDSQKFNDLFDGIPFCYIPPTTAYVYGAFDALQTLALYKFQRPFLTIGKDECSEYDLEGIAKIFSEEEMKVLPVVVDMKIRGIEIDLKKAESLRDVYDKKIKEEELLFYSSMEYFNSDIQEYNELHYDKPIQIPINYNSPDQLKMFIYGVVKTGVIVKKKPTGTGIEVLEAIMYMDRFKDTPLQKAVSHLIKLRQYGKLKNSFVDKLPLVAREHGGRIHAQFNSAGTVTGRFSSSDPNIQNIPSKVTDIRQMFTAGKGRMYIGADFSKQELVIAMCASNDKSLMKSYTDGLDTYSYIASLAYDIPYEDALEHYPDGTTNKDGKAKRSEAKKIVLGTLYSKSVKSIGEDLNVSMEKAQEIYDSIMTAFPTLSAWIESNIKMAYELGYTKNIYGRKRRLPELLLPDYEYKFPSHVDTKTVEYYTNVLDKKFRLAKWKSDIDSVYEFAKTNGIIVHSNVKKKQKAHREIINSLVQSVAASITKRAMINIANNKRLQELDCKIEITVHDENICSCPIENVVEAVPIIQKCMTDAGIGLQLPLSTDIAISDCWYGDEYVIKDGCLCKLKEL